VKFVKAIVNFGLFYNFTLLANNKHSTTRKSQPSLHFTQLITEIFIFFFHFYYSFIHFIFRVLIYIFCNYQPLLSDFARVPQKYIVALRCTCGNEF